MAEDEDLEVLGAVVPVRSTTSDEQAREGADEKVDERPHQPIVVGDPIANRGFRPPRALGCSVPPSRPGRRVHRTVQCGPPRRGRPGHPNPDPVSQGECLRGAVRGDRAPRVPRPRPDLRSSAPRASAPGVRRALRGGETPSGTELGRARRSPNTAGLGDDPCACRTEGRARRADPRVSPGGVMGFLNPSGWPPSATLIASRRSASSGA
jgi:hypothetical protein